MILSTTCLALMGVALVNAGHISLLRGHNCAIEGTDKQKVLEVHTGGPISCVALTGTWQSAVCHWSDDWPCTFKLYATTNCQSGSLIHTIGTGTPSDKCMNAPGQYLGISVLCGAQTKRDDAQNDTVEERSLDERALPWEWQWTWPFIGRRAVLLRPGGTLYDDYEELVTTTAWGEPMIPANPPTNVMGVGVAGTLARRLRDRGWADNSSSSLRVETGAGDTHVSVTLVAERFVENGISRRLTIAQLVQGLQAGRLQGHIIDAFDRARRSGADHATVYGKWGADATTFSISIYRGT